MVEHKRSKQLYALKYIDKAKCIKQKAVANIVQERRLLEEVSFISSPMDSHLLSLSRSADRPSFCRQHALRVSGRRKLLLRPRSHARWRSQVYVLFVEPSVSRHLTVLYLVHLERLGSLPEDVVRFYMAELSSALSYLHEHRIIHRFVRL